MEVLLTYNKKIRIMISYILLGIPIGVLLLTIIYVLFIKKEPRSNTPKKTPSLDEPYYDKKDKKLYVPLEGDTIHMYDFSDEEKEPLIKNK